MSCCLALALGVSLEDQFVKLSRQKRYLTIPYGSAIGILLAFAIPVDLPNQDVLLSWNFEGNYNLPDQLYYFGTAPTVPDLNQDPDLGDPARRSLRSLTRRHTYQLFQQRLNMFGFDGQACMLRMICEISQTTLEHNGLMGQLLHVLFTPSSSKAEDIPAEFIDAETRGTAGSDCYQLYPSCPESLLDMFTSH
ncbi:uncharacterized protein LOC124366134 isoform X2 [Homalodisca vitripennis]|uniref:uncharacterized protein LOC124366134 isoform X2 n=1 Tax=Homalodisca vitripennis TaxID=197043 RepID=UPI001EEC8E41|nr:uncharacterized protein LOC124366134 isoform X2 [Homalodisca vitripennis]